MIIVASRTAMDKALADPKRAVVLLKGAKDSSAHAVHDAVRAQKTPCFLVTDLKLISVAEKTLWFGWTGEERYAVVAGEDRQVKKQGKLADLLRKDGKPAAAAIDALLS